ncbi:MAG: outer membrane beta-barrel protein [Acidobacteriota bacterium]
MRTPALRPAWAFPKWTLALAAGACLAVPATATPLGLYVGGAYGVTVHARPCAEFDDRAPGGACDRVATGSKWFGGYYLMHNLAAEVAYLRFGTVHRRKGAATATPAVGDIDVADLQDSTRAWTVGVNWQVPIFESFTNHIRVGWSVARHDTTGYITRVQTLGPTTYTTADMRDRDYRHKPYVGAGLSGMVAPNVRLFSGWDFVIDGRHSSHLFSAGLSGEF